MTVFHEYYPFDLSVTTPRDFGCNQWEPKP